MHVLEGLTYASITIEVLAGFAAAYGAWRCIQLLGFADDPRIRELAWFFGLFAVSFLLHAVWVWQVHSLPEPSAVRGAGPLIGNGSSDWNGSAGSRFLGGPPAGAEHVTPALLLHHVAMLGALGVALRAFGPARGMQTAAVGAVTLAFVSDLVPAMLALEAAITLYLAAVALLNHAERKSTGALQVAIGFGLFFLGHLSFLLAHEPGQLRLPVGDVLALVGIVLLVQVVPLVSE